MACAGCAGRQKLLNQAATEVKNLKVRAAAQTTLKVAKSAGQDLRRVVGSSLAARRIRRT